MKNYTQILVPLGTMGKLRKLCGASYPTIRKALKGMVKTVQHLQIREKALELGGVETPSPTTNGSTPDNK